MLGHNIERRLAEYIKKIRKEIIDRKKFGRKGQMAGN